MTQSEPRLQNFLIYWTLHTNTRNVFQTSFRSPGHNWI